MHVVGQPVKTCAVLELALVVIAVEHAGGDAVDRPEFHREIEVERGVGLLVVHDALVLHHPAEAPGQQRRIVLDLPFEERRMAEAVEGRAIEEAIEAVLAVAGCPPLGFGVADAKVQYHPVETMVVLDIERFGFAVGHPVDDVVFGVVVGHLARDDAVTDETGGLGIDGAATGLAVEPLIAVVVGVVRVELRRQVGHGQFAVLARTPLAGDQRGLALARLFEIGIANRTRSPGIAEAEVLALETENLGSVANEGPVLLGQGEVESERL